MDCYSGERRTSEVFPSCFASIIRSSLRAASAKSVSTTSGACYGLFGLFLERHHPRVTARFHSQFLGIDFGKPRQLV
jgi:hypothetical protein